MDSSPVEPVEKLDGLGSPLSSPHKEKRIGLDHNRIRGDQPPRLGLRLLEKNSGRRVSSVSLNQKGKEAAAVHEDRLQRLSVRAYTWPRCLYLSIETSVKSDVPVPATSRRAAYVVRPEALEWVESGCREFATSCSKWRRSLTGSCLASSIRSSSLRTNHPRPAGAHVLTSFYTERAPAFPSSPWNNGAGRLG